MQLKAPLFFTFIKYSKKLNSKEILKKKKLCRFQLQQHIHSEQKLKIPIGNCLDKPNNPPQKIAKKK